MQVVALPRSMGDELVICHACFMVLAFAIFLPTGAFLAHTGYHKIHVYCQLTGILFAVVGFVLIVVYISLNNWDHFQILVEPRNNPHTILGLIILIMATIIQPIAIIKKYVPIHHYNGALIICLGWINISLGMYYLTSASKYEKYRTGLLVFFFIYIAFYTVNYIFDPFRMRQKRLIELAQMKARGKDTKIDLRRLMDEKVNQARPNDLSVRKEWEISMSHRSSSITYARPGSRK